MCPKKENYKWSKGELSVKDNSVRFGFEVLRLFIVYKKNQSEIAEITGKSRQRINQVLRMAQGYKLLPKITSAARQRNWFKKKVREDEAFSKELYTVVDRAVMFLFKSEDPCSTKSIAIGINYMKGISSLSVALSRELEKENSRIIRPSRGMWSLREGYSPGVLLSL